MNYLKLINLIFYKITLDKSIYIPKMNILSWELLHDEFWAKEVTSNTVCFQCVFKDIWLKMILLQKIMVFLYYMVAYNFLQLNSFRVWDFSLMCDHNFVKVSYGNDPPSSDFVSFQCMRFYTDENLTLLKSTIL